MASVTIQSVKKNFGAVPILHGVDIDIADGSFTVLVGPSGCGKSTLLRMIAGLEEISGGEIRIGNKRVNELPPKERDIAMVFQNYALYPHMTVGRNMAFSLMLAKESQAVIDQKVGRAAEILGLTPLLDRYPRQLSGGQRQRVAMGRAIVRDPQVFLFDEPLSNLDAKLRIEMRSEIKQLHRRLENTVVYVTHDQVEAMTLADRVVVMHQGRIEQAAPPLELYEHPANTFVAAFIGAPSMNFVPGRVAADGGAVELDGGGRVRLADGRLGNQGGRQVTLGIRPEHVLPGDAEALALQVREIEPLGPHQLAIGELAGARFVAQLPPHHPLAIGAPCPIVADPARVHLFDPASGRAI